MEDNEPLIKFSQMFFNSAPGYWWFKHSELLYKSLERVIEVLHPYKILVPVIPVESEGLKVLSNK